jgi:hypothetical protein
MLVIAALPRTGRLRRQIARAFIANDFRPLMMGDLLPWCYPRIKLGKIGTDTIFAELSRRLLVRLIAV